MHRILCGGQDIFQAQALGRPLVSKTLWPTQGVALGNPLSFKNALATVQNSSRTSLCGQKKLWPPYRIALERSSGLQKCFGHRTE